MLSGSLTDPRYLRTLLAKAQVQPSRGAGQNFLICAEVVEATLMAVRGAPQRITELGAGLGTLTLPLLEQGFTVRAIEREQRLAGILESLTPKRLKSQLGLTVADLRAVPWEHPEAYQLVGNIPYSLSGLILRRLTQLQPPPTQVILLVQREVGERLLAAPPDMHLISVAVQAWGNVQRLLQVPASCFWPEPKVDSMLVLITPHSEVSATIEDREAMLAIARRCFQARRKQLGGVLQRAFRLTDEELTTILAAADVSPAQRPQELNLAQWQHLAASLEKRST